MGIMVMDSTPPATTISAPPAMMRSAAMAIACRPDEQKRLMVMAETSTGRPARDVHALLDFRHGAAEDDIFDLFGIDLRHALERALDGHRGQIIGARRPQRSFVSLTHRRTHGTDDYDFT